jgi:hypothetical protein
MGEKRTTVDKETMHLQTSNAAQCLDYSTATWLHRGLPAIQNSKSAKYPETSPGIEIQDMCLQLGHTRNDRQSTEEESTERA